MCYSYVQSRKPAVTGHSMTNTRTTIIDGDTEQLFRPVDLIPCITCVLTHGQKAFNFDYSKNVKAVGIGQFIPPPPKKKKTVRKSVKQLIKIGMA